MCLTQKEGLHKGSPLSPALANIYMDWLERLRLIDNDTIVIWQYSKEKVIEFFEYLNNLTPCIKFTYELESNNSLPFLDELVPYFLA